jgi:hypothetical protein
MSEANFSVRTQADLSGLRAMNSMLDDIARKSKMIVETWAGARFPGTAQSAVAAGGGTVSPANTGTPQRRMQRAGQTAGQQYNLNTPQGLYQWYENVYEPEAGVLAQMAQGFGQKFYGTRSRRAPMQTTMPTTSSIQPTQKQIENWFGALGPNARKMMTPDVYSAYTKTVIASEGANNFGAIQEFANRYGSQLGAPTGAPPVPPAGGGGSGGGGGFGSEFGMALGTFAKRSLPFVSVVAAADYTKNQITGGYNLWQQQSGPVSQLAHSMSTAATNVEQFRQAIVTAGAQFGATGVQATQMAQSLGQFFGNLGQSGIVNLVGSTSKFAVQNGFTYQQATQLTNPSALFGVTNGYGASMTGAQYQNMLTNAVSAAGMQGRNGPFDTGFTAATNAVASQNLSVPNVQYLSGMYAQSTKTLGDVRGGQLFSQLNNSVINASGTTQGILFAAMNRTLGGKLSSQDIVNVLAAQQGGLSSNVPTTNVKLGASLYQYMKNSGMSYDQQVLDMSQFLGGNINKAKLFLKNPNNFGQVPISTQNKTPFWRSMYDDLQRVMANYGNSQANYGTAIAPLAMATHIFGSPLNVAATLAGSYMVKRGLGSILGRGVGSGLATMVESSPSVLSRVGSGLGGIWSRFGGAIKGAGLDVLGGAEEVGGAALDATGVGAVGGVPLNVLGAGTIALGTGMLAKNIYNQSTAAHAQTVTMHTAQVRQQAAQRISSNMSLKSVTIDQLKISNITLPSSMKSLMSSSVNGGSAYAPTSGSSGGGWWSSFTNWLGGLFGGGGGGSVPTSLPGKGNSAQIWNFLKSKGLSSGAAAGVMGNLAQESSLNPNAPGGGIAQWIGGRQSALQAYAKAHGTSPNALSTQLGYLWKEMSSGDYVSVSALNKMGPSQAAQYFETNFERAGTPMMGNRIGYAAGYYNEFGSTSTVHVSSQSAAQIGHAVASAFSARFGNLPTGTGGAIRP